MGIFDAIKGKVTGFIFGKTLIDYGVIASVGSETFNLLLAEKDGKANIWLKITRKQPGETEINHHILDKNAAEQLVVRLSEALKYAKDNQVNLI